MTHYLLSRRVNERIKGAVMADRIGWVDNLRALACLMVVLIHSTTYAITAAGAPGDHHWEVANLLNSASRAGVPLFFMISGYLFFGERRAGKKHFIRIGLCILFYSAVALVYMAVLTPIDAGNALRQLLRKPVFYHLWFFYAVGVIYLLSPLIRVPAVTGKYLAAAIVALALVANPNMYAVSVGTLPVLPVNLYITGDTFYYLLYAVAGRALGELTPPRWVVAGALPVFLAAAALIAVGTQQQTVVNENFTQTFYLYAHPLVFTSAVSLMVMFKAACLRDALPGLSTLARHSLAIYGFHALIIHFMRTHGLALTAWPTLDIFYVFLCSVSGSLLLSMLLRRWDTRRWVS